MMLIMTSSSIGLSAPSIPHDLRGAILLRSIGYEYGFAGRRGPAVIAVVGDSSIDSAEDAAAMTTVFTKLVEKTPVAGRRTTVVRITHDSRAKTQEALRALKAEVVYIARGLSSTSLDIPLHQGDLTRIIVCGDVDDVKRGCALAVARVGDKPQLLLNVKHTNAAGLRFNPQLLRLAHIVD